MGTQEWQIKFLVRNIPEPMLDKILFTCSFQSNVNLLIINPCETLHFYTLFLTVYSIFNSFCGVFNNLFKQIGIFSLVLI